MRTRNAIEERLSTLMQAYQFTLAHRNELSEEGLAKLRTLEENIQLLKWCLDKPDPQEISWAAVRDTFKRGLTLFRARLFGTPESPAPASDTAHPTTP